MKSILLASVASVAFAGVAAAEVTWSGEASAEYNSVTGYATSAALTASMSQELDNGLTVSAEISVLADEGDDDDEATYGSITLSSDNASLTFGTGLDGAAFTAVGDDIAIGDGEEGVDGIVGSYTMGATTVTLSIPMAEEATGIDSADLEVGMTTDLNGWSLGLGIADSEYVGTVAGTVAGADLAFATSSIGEWDASVSYPAGPVTLSGSTDEASAWTIGAAYESDGVAIGAEYNSDETYEITAGYTMDALSVDLGFDGSDVSLDVAYDMGALTVGAGRTYAGENYARADYDLGGGASAMVTYADAVDIDPAEDIAEGTTVGVTFAF
jgi:outer membrane protein OmpU